MSSKRVSDRRKIRIYQEIQEVETEYLHTRVFIKLELGTFLLKKKKIEIDQWKYYLFNKIVLIQKLIKEIVLLMTNIDFFNNILYYIILYKIPTYCWLTYNLKI